MRASALTDGWSFRTRDTVATETPASAATSLMLAIAGPPPCESVESFSRLTKRIGNDYIPPFKGWGEGETGL
ncbi:hypothetical protein SY2F82_08120 [Streptomyces sp. Y2F8-2]|nr:hypothetical protein SY2F82_08120 [Streptomyces sp. Y2F8-2]